MKPKSLGNLIIERDGTGVLAMFPDGSVKPYTSYARMLNGARAWAKRATKPGEISTLAIVSHWGNHQNIYATSETAQ